MALTETQLAQYWDQGCLLPLRVLEADKAREYAQGFTQLRAQFENDHRLRQPYLVYERENFHVVSTAAAELAALPELGDIVSAIIGDDLLVWSVELIIKPPKSEKLITMHQDLTYWGLTQPDKLVSAWIALDDVDQTNGGMKFVRGSHRLGQQDHEDTFAENNALSRGQQVMAEWPPEDEIEVNLEAGEMSLHHGLMFHGSGPNITDKPRFGIAIRFVSPAVTQTAAPEDHVLVVRGKNTSDSLTSISAPTQSFSDAALTLWDEVAAASQAAFGQNAEREASYLR